MESTLNLTHNIYNVEKEVESLENSILKLDEIIPLQNNIKDNEYEEGYIYAINKETINILTYKEKEFLKNLLKLFKKENYGNYLMENMIIL